MPPFTWAFLTYPAEGQFKQGDFKVTTRSVLFDMGNSLSFPANRAQNDIIESQLDEVKGFILYSSLNGDWVGPIYNAAGGSELAFQKKTT